MPQAQAVSEVDQDGVVRDGAVAGDPEGELLDRGEVDRVRGRLDGGGHAVFLSCAAPGRCRCPDSVEDPSVRAMSARSHAARGHDRRVTAASARLRYMTHERRATPYDATALGTVLTVWAHPDDEAYLAGGLLAAVRDAGNRAVCVTATRGEAADPQADVSGAGRAGRTYALLSWRPPSAFSASLSITGWIFRTAAWPSWTPRARLAGCRHSSTTSGPTRW